MSVTRTSIATSLIVSGIVIAVVGMRTRSTVEVAAKEAAPVVAKAVTATGTPVLSGLAVKKLTASSTAQPVTVHGQTLADATTARLFTPDGLVISYGSSSIEHAAPGGFRLLMDLSAPGSYVLVVRNRAGNASNELKFDVTGIRDSR